MINVTDVTDVTYESLAGDNLDALLPVLKQAGMALAYPQLAEPIVAKVNGEIVGFAFAQLLPHLEPVYVLPLFRGTGIAEELVRRAMAIIEKTGAERYMCVAQNPFAEKLCKQLGMRAVLGTLYVKDSEGG